MDEPDEGAAGHEVTIVNREQMTIRGVLRVDSFDDQEVVLDTDLGTLTVRGEDLHIKQLDLDQGSFAVDGLITSLQYAAGGRGRGVKTKGRGILDRLLR
jgi:sporulation protein YabP